MEHQDEQHTGQHTERGPRGPRGRQEAASLPFDEEGRYSPAPGVEYPFAVSDIARAAARLLGPSWLAEAAPWGVAGCIEHADEHADEQGASFHLGIDDEGDLYVSANLRDESPTYLTGACAAEGLPVLAARVAETVRGIRAED